MIAIDMTGQRFGCITAIRIARNAVSGKLKWLCRCDCGSEFVTCGGKVRSGEVKTCPKCSKERVRGSRVKHGMRKSAEHRIWSHIKSRCFNPNVPEFRNYGGRGITMCLRWAESFEAFISDMGLRPSADLSIDRIDNEGNYEPGNCRWASKKTQANNTRANRKIQIGDETRNMSQWADSIGACREVIYKRIKRGKSGHDLVKKPFEAEKIAFQGRSATIPEWSRINGIKKATLYWRINKQHWPLERAITQGALL